MTPRSDSERPKTYHKLESAHSKQSKGRSWKRSAKGYWKNLVASCVILGAFCGLIGLLSYLNGRPILSLAKAIYLNMTLLILASLMLGCLEGIIGSCIDQSMWLDYATRPCSLHTMIYFDKASRGGFVMYQSYWRDLPANKTSPLPYIYRSQGLVQTGRPLDSASDLKTHSKTLHVKPLETVSGLHFGEIDGKDS